MRNELASIEKIELYLMGKMDNIQKNEFENALNSNTELQLQTSFQANLMEGIAQLGLKNATKLAWRKYTIKKWTKRAGILLLLILAVAGSIILFSENSENTVEPNQNSRINPETVLSSDTLSSDTNTSIYADTAFAGLGDSVIQDKPLIQSNKKTQNEKMADNNKPMDAVSVESVKNTVIKPDQSVASDQINSTSINTSANENELTCQWQISQKTTKTDLENFYREIEQCNGKIRTMSVNYRNGGISKISFVVTNKSGQVEYHSPDLRDGFIICINFYEKGISAGVCDDRLNEVQEVDSLFIHTSDNHELTKKEKEAGNQLLSVNSDDYEKNNPGKQKRKMKRKRFFTQTEKLESGRKRGDYKSKKKYYR
ncbi:MAG: hypothetical protein JNJ99_02520 [Crocinitomicaceae bacterium]|nr:hypothetical protein [Crocinitomicaceae bacterium]